MQQRPSSIKPASVSNPIHLSTWISSFFLIYFNDSPMKIPIKPTWIHVGPQATIMPLAFTAMPAGDLFPDFPGGTFRNIM